MSKDDSPYDTSKSKLPECKKSKKLLEDPYDLSSGKDREEVLKKKDKK